MSLAEWIDGYRRFDPRNVTRPRVDAIDDWEEQDLLAPGDRVHDTTPRWMTRARTVGYARPTQI